MIARYEYDGLNRRVKAHIDAQAPAEPNGVDHYRHFYYNASWQILGSSGDIDLNWLD